MLIRHIGKFIADLYRNRFVIKELSKRDFRNMYIGSTLGVIWTFIQPLTMTLILWIVFAFGFRSQSIDGVPFIIYLLTGLVPWNFFSETLIKNTTVIQEYAFIVKKVQFRVSILSIVKICSALLVYAIFLIILIIFLIMYGMPFSFYWFQSLYYLFAMTVLLLAYSWIFASINVFFKDTAQIIGIAVQIGFWLTPIFWNLNMFPPEFHYLFRINPMFYIIEGYRNSFVNFIPFWSDWLYAAYFWTGTLLTLLIGIFTFIRLRSHFADVL